MHIDAIYELVCMQCTLTLSPYHYVCMCVCVLFPDGLYFRKEFAYATSDGHVFVRRFALSARDWQMVRTLTGHTAEIAQVSDGGGGSTNMTDRLTTD